MAHNFSPYAARGANIGARQNVANMMRLQSLRPIQNTSNHPGAALSPFQAINQVAQAYASGKLQDRVGQDQMQLAQQVQGDTNMGLQQFHEQFKQDPHRAVAEAMAHPSDQVRSYAEQMNKGLNTQKDLAKMSTPESVLQNPNDPSQYVGKKTLTSHQPGSVVSDESGNFVNPGVQPGAGPVISRDENGALMQSTPTGIRKVDQAPRITNSVNVGKIHPGMKKLFEIGAGRVDEMGKSAYAGTQTLQSLNELKQKADAGIFENVTSGPAAFMTNLAQALDAPLSKDQLDKLANTESFNAETIGLWNSIISSQEGGHKGVVKEEAELIMKSLPLARHSPQARQQIIDTLSRAAERNIKSYEQSAQAYVEAVTTEDPSKLTDLFSQVYVPESARTIEEPAKQESTQGQGNRISLEDFMKEIGN